LDRKVVRKFVGLIFGAIFLYGVQYIANVGLTSAAIKAKEMSGNSWDDFRTEYELKLREDLASGFFNFDPKTTENLIKCEADAMISWLNSTNCSRQFNSFLTTEVKANKEIEGCLQAYNVDQKTDEIEVKCIVAHSPNNWKFIEKAIVTRLKEDIAELEVSEELKDSQILENYVNCISKQHVEILDASDCKPLNENATTNENLMSTCFEDAYANVANSKKIDKASEKCLQTAH
jgi:hypothetical protein